MDLASTAERALARTVLGLAPVAVFAMGAAAPAAEIRFAAEAEPATVEVHGLDAALLARLSRHPPAPEDWPEIFAVYTEEASRSPRRLPPLLGGYELEPRSVRFTPRFPFVAGQTYVARFVDPASGEEVRAAYSVPAVDLPPTTRLIGIYPSARAVPENLLRIYLQFSAPMSRGHARHHIRLLDGAGEAVAGPFVAPERELWSPDGTRLTLFFDPGRIKRGVGPHEEVGPPLAAGGRYLLEIDHELTDARGVPLVRDFHKEFEVVAPDRDQPRTDEWRLTPPAGPGDPLRLAFPEPLDRGLLEGVLAVLDEEGAEVPGRVTVGLGETAWSFAPAGAWGPGVYRLRVATLLEDLAGNSLRRPFEAALDGRREAEVAYVDLPFSLQDPSRPDPCRALRSRAGTAYPDLCRPG